MRELERRIENIVQVGTVVEVDSNRALARVNVLGRVTDFLPVKMIGNDFVKIWLPARVGEQVLVVCPYGDADSGFVIPSIFHKTCKEPQGAANDKAIVEFAGGVRIETDGVKVNVTAPNGIAIEAPHVSISGDLHVGGVITDVKGDLTNHTHDTTDGATAKAR